MTWFKNKEAECLGICADCVYRDEFVHDYCVITGAEIKKGMPDTCEMKSVGGCENCNNRISEIKDCRGVKACQCCLETMDNRFVKVRTKCRNYIKVEEY